MLAISSCILDYVLGIVIHVREIGMKEIPVPLVEIVFVVCQFVWWSASVATWLPGIPTSHKNPPAFWTSTGQPSASTPSAPTPLPLSHLPSTPSASSSSASTPSASAPVA